MGQDTRIYIGTQKEDEFAKLAIGNNAALKTDLEIEGMFEPLHELDKLNTKEHLGASAGVNQNLYLMRELLKPYRGTVEVMNRGSEGVDYIAKIPVYR